MPKFFATFGSGHPLANRVIGIHAESEDDARKGMFRTFGDKWASIYDWDDFSRQGEAYGLIPIFFMKAEPGDYGAPVTAKWLHKEEFFMECGDVVMTEETSKEAATAASETLSDSEALLKAAHQLAYDARKLARQIEDYVEDAKSAAGSALTQKEE